MAILQYIGDRPYVEFTVEQTTYGFARGTQRTDVPAELLERFKGDNYPQWKVIFEEKEVVEEKTKKMADVIEPTVVEEVVEEPVEEVVEEPQTTEETEAFDTSWTRAKMVEWVEANGGTVPQKATKAQISEIAHALSNKGDE